MVEPFLKWAGGKRTVATLIRSAMPEVIKTYVEPFAGAGAVYGVVTAERYILADSNKELINTYLQLRQHGKEFIDRCKELFIGGNDESTFIERRMKFNFDCRWDDFERAALFVYLNRHCFNGLCRFNNSGQFNVPFGKYKNVYFPEEEMRLFHHKLRDCTILNNSPFQHTLSAANDIGPGTVVYCDPPYVPASATSNFTKYAKEDFNLDHHKALAEWCETLRDSGVTVLVTNNDLPITRVLYTNADHLIEFSSKRSVGANSHGYADEVLAIYKGN